MDILLAIDISETQYRTADTADKLLYSDWLVSLKLSYDWLG